MVKTLFNSIETPTKNRHIYILSNNPHPLRTFAFKSVHFIYEAFLNQEDSSTLQFLDFPAVQARGLGFGEWGMALQLGLVMATGPKTGIRRSDTQSPFRTTTNAQTMKRNFCTTASLRRNVISCDKIQS